MAYKFFKPNKGKENYINRYNDIKSKYNDCIISKKFSNNYYDINLKIQPTLESNTYLVNIKHFKSTKPEVYVTEPNIYVLTNGIKPPHVYKFDEQTCKICLYMNDDWDNSKYDSDLIPWISEWLFYFEMWLITGEWYGGGHGNEKNT